MAQFTPISCYSLKSHSIEFDQNGVQIILNSTGQKVDEVLFSSGVSIRIVEEDFCLGTIKFDDSFKVSIDLSKPNAGVIFDADGPVPYFIGTTDFTDVGITKHSYNLMDCPVQITKSGNVLTIRASGSKTGYTTK